MMPDFALCAKIWRVQVSVGNQNQGVDSMVKYARFVYEKKIEDDTHVDQAAAELDEELQEYILNNTVLASDIEISDKPYSGK
jgi:hypothetical protein